MLLIWGEKVSMGLKDHLRVFRPSLNARGGESGESFTCREVSAAKVGTGVRGKEKTQPKSKPWVMESVRSLCIFMLTTPMALLLMWFCSHC